MQGIVGNRIYRNEINLEIVDLRNASGRPMLRSRRDWQRPTILL